MSYTSLFYPESIAVIGASRTPKSVGNDLVKNLVEQGYTGKIYPINPQADELYGLKVYHTLAETPEAVELAVIAIPAKFVPQALNEAADHGAKAAIVISAGFKEIGNADLEDEVARICEERDIALIGPNCLGVINPEIGMNASFAGIMPKAGPIAFISQSGALCSSILDFAREFNLGFSKFLSIGNKAVIDEVKLLEYLNEDPQTKVIAMYVEQLEDAERFIKAVHQVNKNPNPKPVLILKSGRTEAGASAIASHTGSLAGGDAAYEALFAQAGVIRPNTVRELFEYIDVFAHNPLHNVQNVTIVTNAGGPGVITTDEVIKSGLSLTEIDETTQQKLRTFLPEAANVHNPIDILGDAKADRYKQTLEILIEDKKTDAIMVLLTPQTMTEIPETADILIDIKQRTSKPLVACFMGKLTVRESRNKMEAAGVSTTSFPELGVRGLALMGKFMASTELVDTSSYSLAPAKSAELDAIFESVRANSQSALLESQALTVCDAYQLPTLKRRELLSLEEAQQAQEYFTSPVALKIVSPEILHKSDVGGVMLNVEPQNIATAYQELLKRVHANVPTANLKGALAVEMAPKDGLEMIIGAKRVPSLGAMVMIGLGGVYVEVFKDIEFAFTPFSPDYARSIVNKLKSSAILHGTRGHQGYDVEAIVDILGKMSQLMTDYPHIAELDINPLLVLPKGQGAKVLDARILLTTE
jgi:acetyltransferase